MPCLHRILAHLNIKGAKTFKRNLHRTTALRRQHRKKVTPILLLINVPNTVSSKYQSITQQRHQLEYTVSSSLQASQAPMGRSSLPLVVVIESHTAWATIFQ